MVVQRLCLASARYCLDAYTLNELRTLDLDSHYPELTAINWRPRPLPRALRVALSCRLTAGPRRNGLESVRVRLGDCAFNGR